MSDFRPNWLVLHDYGKEPTSDFNPYNALVYGGKVRYRDPNNPYGVRAPHAYKLNGDSVGLAWGGPVGGQPNPEDLALLKAEYEKVKALYPEIVAEGHGEAFARTKGTPQQASKNGRDLIEAAWRKELLGVPGVAPPAGVEPITQKADIGLLPIANRGIAFGHPNATPPPVPASVMASGPSPPPTPSASPSLPTPAGAFQMPGLASLGKGAAGLAGAFGGGGEDDQAMQKANAQGLEESERAAMAALQAMMKRPKRTMANTMAPIDERLGAFA